MDSDKACVKCFYIRLGVEVAYAVSWGALGTIMATQLFNNKSPYMKHCTIETASPIIYSIFSHYVFYGANPNLYLHYVTYGALLLRIEYPMLDSGKTRAIYCAVHSNSYKQQNICFIHVKAMNALLLFRFAPYVP